MSPLIVPKLIVEGIYTNERLDAINPKSMLGIDVSNVTDRLSIIALSMAIMEYSFGKETYNTPEAPALQEEAVVLVMPPWVTKFHCSGNIALGTSSDSTHTLLTMSTCFYGMAQIEGRTYQK